MKKYLKYQDGSFSDFADYPQGEPFPAPSGATWVNGDPVNLPANKPLSLAERLDTVFMQLPPEVRGQFYPLKAAVKLALEQGDTLGALAIIQITSVPTDLQDAKDAMLSIFSQEGP